jgi:tRNA (guanine37-N1)-methyltransferase
MNIDILTIFPEMFTGPLTNSILQRAQKDDLVKLKVHNLRDWTTDRHRSVDAPPYGGGAGMVMRVDIIDRAVGEIKSKSDLKPKVILLDTKGKLFTQNQAQLLSTQSHLIFIAGHYEGVDHRVHEHIADEVISIGNFVLTGGELPTMVVVDAMVRLIPGVLGNPASLLEESHGSDGEIEYPQYTRPEEYQGWKVPPVLLSGNHAEIDSWRKSQKK